MKPQALEGCHVLLVEDDYLQAREATAILERAGARVIGPVGTAQHAFALMEEHKLDGAILDINLGTGPSFDIADRLQAAGVPFVFLTGYDQASIPARFTEIARGQKPVREARLVELISTFCD